MSLVRHRGKGNVVRRMFADVDADIYVMADGDGTYDASVAQMLVDALSAHGCVPGYPLGRYYPGMEDVLLVACTERNSRQQIGMLAETVGGLL